MTAADLTTEQREIVVRVLKKLRREVFIEPTMPPQNSDTAVGKIDRIIYQIDRAQRAEDGLMLPLHYPAEIA